MSNLEQYATALSQQGLAELFADNAQRFQQFSLQAGDLFLDYSKNWLDQRCFDCLIELAEDKNLPGAIKQLFSGEKVNHTEGRAAMHMALRNPDSVSVLIDDEDVMPQVVAERERIKAFVQAIYDGHWRGYTDQLITDVVNIGIGGSDLGPRMVVEALKPYHVKDVTCHYVANVDGADIADVLQQLEPETTLFIIASKTFTTQETLLNANTAKAWLQEAMPSRKAIAKHFVAITSHINNAVKFGIDEENCFAMWDWVGGRYSLWSSIGLSIALAIGYEGFEALLAGAHEIDRHFQSAPLTDNMPVILGVLSYYYVKYCHARSEAVLPYSQYLDKLPSYLQQAVMESLGKSVKNDGSSVGYATCPILWGGIGTNGQHAFHQLLHQGTVLNPIDFILPLHGHTGLEEHQKTLVAHCLAQSQALMQGQQEDDIYAVLLAQGMDNTKASLLAKHKTIPGNRPNNMLVFNQLTPHSLGSLIALYEHKIYVLSVLWDLNAFDQWGVELGKKLAGPILTALNDEEVETNLDPSTDGLVSRYHYTSNI